MWDIVYAILIAEAIMGVVGIIVGGILLVLKDKFLGD